MSSQKYTHLFTLFCLSIVGKWWSLASSFFSKDSDEVSFTALDRLVHSFILRRHTISCMLKRLVLLNLGSIVQIYNNGLDITIILLIIYFPTNLFPGAVAPQIDFSLRSSHTFWPVTYYSALLSSQFATLAQLYPRSRATTLGSQKESSFQNMRLAVTIAYVVPALQPRYVSAIAGVPFFGVCAGADVDCNP